MNSSRSYLVKALIDWIVDNGCTPHIVLDATFEDLVAPTEFADEDRLVLNVSGSAVRGFRLNPNGLEFDARFKGVSRSVRAPIGSILRVFARENGLGMTFEPDRTHSQKKEATKSTTATPKLPPHLRLVKD